MALAHSNCDGTGVFSHVLKSEMTLKSLQEGEKQA